jgi:hypothetical protein
LLADHGPASPAERLSIHRSHPNGGGLRALLETSGFAVHEASYGSELGERTDLLDWLPKFRARMADILVSAGQDLRLAAGRNQVVMFKSCYPNSAFRADRAGVADPAGPELTPANARASFMALREEFAREPAVLFVYLTAPPLPLNAASPAWKRLARRVLGRPAPEVEQRESARRAREFNHWMQAPDGWLAGYTGGNIAVFDYFDVLTGDASTAPRGDFLAYATAGGRDAHPSAEGQRLAASRLAPFLERAWSHFQQARPS